MIQPQKIGPYKTIGTPFLVTYKLEDFFPVNNYFALEVLLHHITLKNFSFKKWIKPFRTTDYYTSTPIFAQKPCKLSDIGHSKNYNTRDTRLDNNRQKAIESSYHNQKFRLHEQRTP